MVNYKRNLKKNKMSNMWHNMHQRCYSEKYHARRPKYKDCTMCDEWLDDYNTFYDWVRENYYTVDDEQMDLDKDILVKGNRIYSPDTCIYVPHSINVMIENITRKPEYLSKMNKYRMSINVEGKTMVIGYFDTEEEAKLEYIRHKEALILAKAIEYKDKIPKKLYDALANWKIELSDWK